MFIVHACTCICACTCIASYKECNTECTSVLLYYWTSYAVYVCISSTFNTGLLVEICNYRTCPCTCMSMYVCMYACTCTCTCRIRIYESPHGRGHIPLLKLAMNGLITYYTLHIQKALSPSFFHDRFLVIVEIYNI